MSQTPTFDQVPLQSVIERIDKGNLCLIELVNLFKARLEVEEKKIFFSTKTSRVNIYEYEIPSSSSEKALGFFKNYFLYLSQDYAKYHKSMLDNILKRLEGVKNYRTNEITKYKSMVQNCSKEVLLANEALDKAKKYFVKAKTDVQTAKVKLVALEELVIETSKLNEEKKREKEKDSTYSGSGKYFMGQMLKAFESTPEQERDKQEKKLIKKYNHMIDCASDIVMKKKALMTKMEERDGAVQMVRTTDIYCMCNGHWCDDIAGFHGI
jgi:hypothetical protein